MGADGRRGPPEAGVPGYVPPGAGVEPPVQFLNTKLLPYLPLILLSLALGAGLIWARRVWDETHEDDEPASEQERLIEFERAYAAGEIDEAELRRLRDLLDPAGTLRAGKSQSKLKRLADFPAPPGEPPLDPEEPPAPL